MKKIMCFISAGIVLLSCNSNDTKQVSPSTDSVSRPGAGTTEKLQPASVDGCYMMVIAKDTAYLKLTNAGDSVIGDLDYKRFEKDSNKGTVTFVNDGAYLKGWYKFSSEGTISVREIYLKVNGETLAEGYGEVSAKDDSAFYQYPANLKYETQHPFIKSACK